MNNLSHEEFLQENGMTITGWSALCDWVSALAETPMEWINNTINTLWHEVRLSAEDLDTADSELRRIADEYKRSHEARIA